MISNDDPRGNAHARPDEPAGGELVFYPNRQILQPGLTAPVHLAGNPKRSLQAILRQLLSHHDVHAVLIEPAAVAGGSALFGCQEFIFACHDVLESQSAARLEQACDRLLTACREISGTLETAYAFLQVADDIAATPESERPASTANTEETDTAQPGCARMKNLARRLEDFFATPPFEIRIDPAALGRLQVHLDELYDEACRQLENFYTAVLHSPAAAPVARFWRELFQGVARRMVPDHIHGQSADSTADDARGAGTGLLAQLGELADALRK